jgi:rhamnogalacturonan endolyase
MTHTLRHAKDRMLIWCIPKRHFPARPPCGRFAVSPQNSRNSGKERVSRSILATAALATIFSTTVRAADAPVTVNDEGATFALSNGIITAKVSKRSGGLTSLLYNKTEILSGGNHDSGYWSHAATSPQMLQRVTIDPKNNDGLRGEVSIKGICGGNRMGSGPGGSAIADIEIRYTLARGDSGLYTYCIFDHPADYAATAIGEARFCAKLNDDIFDWMTIDANRNMKMITAYDWNHGTVMNMKEARRMNSGIYKGQVEHKYDYSTSQFDTLAWGWSSTQKQIGFWFINPTIEYLSGGPTKMELSAHRDATFGTNIEAPAPPTLLNYWRGSHYGGSSCVIAKGEKWNKVIGPFLLYCNTGVTPDAAWKEALTRSAQESKAWPYDWVNGVDYPHKDQRSTVSGQLFLNDPQAASARLPNLLVGLTAADYTAPGARGGKTTVDWQLDAKYYQFWTRGDEEGHFSIPNVRAGSYTLHAIADGVLGEFSKENVVVTDRKVLDLSRLQWKPVRHGQQLWEIGIADRTAREFLHGDHYWQWGLYNQYPQDFPNDVNFVIGKSDFHKDWNYCQCPRADRPNGTTWSISFDLPVEVSGKATLRIALAAVSARRIDISINDKSAGSVGPLQDTATIRRDGIRGYWSERDVTFDAALMKAGINTLKLTIPPGNPMSGVEYDYLRLELDPELPK